MNVTIKLRDDQPMLLDKIKRVRRTWNNNQIFREALYAYAEKILPDSVHECTNNYSATPSFPAEGK